MCGSEDEQSAFEAEIEAQMARCRAEGRAEVLGELTGPTAIAVAAPVIEAMESRHSEGAIAHAVLSSVARALRAGGS